MQLRRPLASSSVRVAQALSTRWQPSGSGSGASHTAQPTRRTGYQRPGKDGGTDSSVERDAGVHYESEATGHATHHMDVRLWHSELSLGALWQRQAQASTRVPNGCPGQQQSWCNPAPSPPLESRQTARGSPCRKAMRYIFAPRDIECNVWGTRFGTGAAPALRGWVGEFERLDKFLQHGHVLRRFVFSVLVGIRCFDRRPRRLQDPRKRKAKLSRKRPEAYHLPRRLQMKQTRLRLHKCDDNRESCDGVHKGCTLGSGG